MAEPDTKELDALLDSLNGSAERFQTLWFSFLGLTLYLAIAALTTTHRMLLLGEAQTLPILNIKVELLPFYVIAPLLYLVFHFYLLMMLVLLARTAAPFERELRAVLPIEADRERYRAKVENALFVQLLVGATPERTGFNGYLLASIAFLTIVVAPLATLILIQMQFLPYHSFTITWWHRVAVFTDLSLLTIIMALSALKWRRYLASSDFIRWPIGLGGRDKTRNLAALAASLGVIAAVPWLSLWEGRWAGENYIGRADLAADLTRDLAGWGNGTVLGLFKDRLILPNETIVDEKTLADVEKEIASRGGDFVPTIRFEDRDLQAADLRGADLRGVALDRAHMQGAELRTARLDGARLVEAELQGADLQGAQLPGADLSQADLQGAILWRTRLQGANLVQAHLQGASIGGAELQGADLTRALLQGAYIGGAQLQGAALTGVQAIDSEFDSNFVFRTDITEAKLDQTTIGPARADMVKVNVPDRGIALLKPDSNLDVGQDFIAALEPVDGESWKAAATRLAKVDEYEEVWLDSGRLQGAIVRTNIAKRFYRLSQNFQTPDQDAKDETTWRAMEASSQVADPGGHRSRLAAILSELACKGDTAPYGRERARFFHEDAKEYRVGAPYVALALLRLQKDRLAALGGQLEEFRNRLLSGRENPTECPGVVGFSDAEWSMLLSIKPMQFQNPTETRPPAAYSP
jgi:uncharacterized protein YjbI with pentapeptide repeats